MNTTSYLKHPSINSEFEFAQNKLFMSRTFFGENPNGIWKLIIETTGFIPPGYIKFLTLNVYGIKNFNYQIQEFKNGSNNMNYINNKIKINLIEKPLQCGKYFHLKVNFDPIYQFTPVYIQLFDKNSKKKINLLETNLTKFISKIFIPCIFQDSNDFELSLFLPYFQIRSNIPILIYNLFENESIYSPRPYQIFNIKNEEINILIKYNFKMIEIPPSIWEQNIIISLYDLKIKRNLLIRSSINNGNLFFNIKNISECLNCLLIITPTFHSNFSTCSTLIQPIIIKKKSTKKISKFIFEKSIYCENFLIKRNSLFNP